VPWVVREGPGHGGIGEGKGLGEWKGKGKGEVREIAFGCWGVDAPGPGRLITSTHCAYAWRDGQVQSKVTNGF